MGNEQHARKQENDGAEARFAKCTRVELIAAIVERLEDLAELHAELVARIPSRYAQRIARRAGYLIMATCAEVARLEAADLEGEHSVAPLCRDCEALRDVTFPFGGAPPVPRAAVSLCRLYSPPRPLCAEHAKEHERCLHDVVPMPKGGA